MSEIRDALRERGITDRREQDVELWKMAHNLLYGRLAEIFEALDEPPAAALQEEGGQDDG